MQTNQTSHNASAATTAQIIGSTETQAREEGTKAFRIVLRFLGAGTETPYITHMETFDEWNQHDGFHYGDYCATMLHGYESLKRRGAKYGLRVLDANGKRIPLKTLNEVI